MFSGTDPSKAAAQLASTGFSTGSCAEGHHRTRLDTPPEIPATELPLLHEMEERAGERRHVWVRYSTKSDQPQPSPVPSSRERTPRPFDALCGPEPRTPLPNPLPFGRGEGGTVGSSLAN